MMLSTTIQCFKRTSRKFQDFSLQVELIIFSTISELLLDKTIYIERDLPIESQQTSSRSKKGKNHKEEVKFSKDMTCEKLVLRPYLHLPLFRAQPALWNKLWPMPPSQIWEQKCLEEQTIVVFFVFFKASTLENAPEGRLAFTKNY